jgi:glycosyltransferase involved in cell wall biosynthesis
MPANNGKPTILALADDLRMNSGVATMMRELVLSTVHKFNWVQIAGAITHPDKGNAYDLSQSTNELKKMKDAYVKLYPTDGYGNEQMLFQIIAMEKPNAIFHFTDPRFWGWLYALEKQIRSTIPLVYLNIWDDIPYPMYNRPFYESCDALFSISKQTMNINRYVLGPNNCCEITDGPMNGRTLLQYCPHGIDSDIFKPLTEKDDKDFPEFKKRVFNGKEYKFIILYNSRNVHRKRTSNIILAYRQFCDNLPKEEAQKCALILHTEIMQDAGTNLLAVKEAFCPDYPIIFSPGKLSPQDMCRLYNIADVTVNASSSEGFGLSCAESIMCGTPVTVTVTGGLQDQIGQTDDQGKPVVFNADIGSNNIGRYKNHGPWAYPVWPVTRLVQGSIPTPYIFDDLTKWEDFADGFMYWYMMGDKKRTILGAEGRRWAMNEGGINSKNMGQTFIDGMDYVFKNWSKPKKFSVHTIKDYVGNTMKDGHSGITFDKIDKEAAQKKIDKWSSWFDGPKSPTPHTNV